MSKVPERPVPMSVDELLDKLLAPTYVYRMALGMVRTPGPRGIGAGKRLDNASKNIEAVLEEYITRKFGRCKRCHRLLDEAGVCWFHNP